MQCRCPCHGDMQKWAYLRAPGRSAVDVGFGLSNSVIGFSAAWLHPGVPPWSLNTMQVFCMAAGSKMHAGAVLGSGAIFEAVFIISYNFIPFRKRK